MKERLVMMRRDLCLIAALSSGPNRYLVLEWRHNNRSGPVTISIIHTFVFSSSFHSCLPSLYRPDIGISMITICLLHIPSSISSTTHTAISNSSEPTITYYPPTNHMIFHSRPRVIHDYLYTSPHNLIPNYHNIP